MFTGVLGWRPRPMMRMLDYLNLYEYDEFNRAEATEKANNMAREVHKFVSFDSLSGGKLFRVNKFIKETIDGLEKEYNKQRIKQAPRILKRNLRYSRAKIFNLQKIKEGDFHEIWVTPIFLPPGRNDFIFRTARDEEVTEQIESSGR